MSSFQNAWLRLKGFVETREIDTMIEWETTADPTVNGQNAAFLTVYEYMDRIEKGYELVPETPPVREG